MHPPVLDKGVRLCANAEGKKERLGEKKWS